jgi:hypothetical protein
MPLFALAASINFPPTLNAIERVCAAEKELPAGGDGRCVESIFESVSGEFSERA